MNEGQGNETCLPGYANSTDRENDSFEVVAILSQYYKKPSGIQPTFDFMFGDVQCRGSQTIQHFTERLKTTEILACF